MLNYEIQMHVEISRMMINIGRDPELLTEAQYGNMKGIDYDGVFIAFDLKDLYWVLKDYGADKITLTL